MVIWITGRAGAGKTTLARGMAKDDSRVVVLDGDEMRHYFPTQFDDRGREDNIVRIAKFAVLLEKQGFVPVVACVSPRRAWRDAARAMFQSSRLIYLPGGSLWPGTEYEEPGEDELS